MVCDSISKYFVETYMLLKFSNKVVDALMLYYTFYFIVEIRKISVRMLSFSMKRIVHLMSAHFGGQDYGIC